MLTPYTSTDTQIHNRCYATSGKGEDSQRGPIEGGTPGFTRPGVAGEPALVPAISPNTVPSQSRLSRILDFLNPRRVLIRETIREIKARGHWQINLQTGSRRWIAGMWSNPDKNFRNQQDAKS